MPSKKSRKRASFILVEVLISSILFVMLLAVIFGVFWRCSKISEILAKQQKKAEEILLVQTVLQEIFFHNVFKVWENSYFFIDDTLGSKNQSLVFTLKPPPGEIDRLGKIAGAKLFVEDGALYLAKWNHSDKMNEMPLMLYKELLLHNVASMQIELFQAPSVKTEKKGAKEALKPLEGQWNHEWPKEFDARPVLVKLICQPLSGNTPMLFWFVHHRDIKTIPYKSG